MKINSIKISYSTTIPIMSYGVNDKIGVELELTPDDSKGANEQFNLEEIIREHKSNVDAIVKKLYPHLYNGIEHTPEFAQMAENIERFNENMYGKKQQSPTHEERRIGDIENDIRSCKELWELETYKLIVKQKPEFQKIYDEVYAKLSNQNKIIP